MFHGQFIEVCVDVRRTACLDYQQFAHALFG